MPKYKRYEINQTMVGSYRVWDGEDLEALFYGKTAKKNALKFCKMKNEEEKWIK